jgi:hypothetical protein
VARRTAIPALVAAVALTALAACSPSSADRSTAGATATLATEPAPTTTTNPYAVPAVIDIAYVNRVLAGLDAITGDAVRNVMATRTIPRDVFDRLKSIYLDNDRLQRAIDGFQLDVRDNMAGYKPVPGNKVTSVTDLITATPSCIFAQVRRNYDAVSTGSTPPINPQWVGLRPLDSTRDPNSYNQTRWAYFFDGFPADRSRPNNPCAS